MKRAIALVLASLALAFAQETKVGGSPADATTMAEPELAADGHPVGYIRNPMLKVLCSPTTTALGQPFYATFEVSRDDDGQQAFLPEDDGAFLAWLTTMDCVHFTQHGSSSTSSSAP